MIALFAALAAPAVLRGADGADTRPRARGVIRWRSGAAVIATQERDVLAQTLAAAHAGPARHLLVQFETALTPAERQALADAGITLLAYVGDQAYFAAIGASLDVDAALRAAPLRAAVTIDTTWKLHPALLAGEPPSWSIVRPEKGPQDANSIPGDRPGPLVAAYVLFHADVPRWPDAERICRAHGATIASRLRAINGLVIELPQAELAALAAEDAVAWVEPPLPKLSEMNDGVRTRSGADKIQNDPYKLTGAGVTAIVYDAGTAVSAHRDFGDRLEEMDASGTSAHATHVAGTLGGNGRMSGGKYAGTAPGVQMLSYGFEQQGGLREGFLYSDPGDLEADYTEAINSYHAHIANNSIGTNIGLNGYPCEWLGDYSVTDALIDAIVRGQISDDVPFRVIWCVGNERRSDRCEQSGFHTVAPPACAKNHITVGAVDSESDAMTDFSSWGPTDDGRLKPDICAPGCQGTDDYGVTSCAIDGQYVVSCGTSMASPAVTGLGAVLLEEYRKQYPGRPDFTNALLKALLAHTAIDLGNPGPDYQFGYGSVRIVPAVELLRSGSFTEADVAQDEIYSVVVAVTGDVKELKATLAWDDPAALPNTEVALVNDLDLRVFDTNGNEYFPWVLDPDQPTSPATRTQPDRLNNLEQVVIDAPPAGVYRVEVRGFNVVEGPQRFALCTTPLLKNCSSQGVIALDRTQYPCEAGATIQVVDCDLNIDRGRIETVLVDVFSTSEPNGETVQLTETGPDTAVFSGTIALSENDREGVLRVAPGDELTAQYTDEEDGTGKSDIVTAVALVHCDAPVVRNVQLVAVDPTHATLTFDTDEPTSALLRYGRECAAPVNELADRRLRLTHRFVLEGLTENTTYFYSIEAADEAENVTLADNDGACFRFSTPHVISYFTQQFTGKFDLQNHSVLLTPDGSENYYAACIRAIDELPTEVQGEILKVEDDEPVQRTLTGGATVQLYGETYGDVWIGPNGYVTFGAGDADNTPTLEDHFRLPRVAALFTDLDARNQGTVRCQQLADRWVTTWDAVPEFGTTNWNTFQIELYFDGRIQISWLRIDATRVLAGVSAGQGEPDGFYETDLSQSTDCGAMPPTASSERVTTLQDTGLRIRLHATDDGLPNPPGRLRYTIRTLPSYELRDPAGNRIITPDQLPYTLSDYGQDVVYRPFGGFIGLDQFEFTTNDGGQPPEGGDSSVAVITVDVGGKRPIYRFDLDEDPGWEREGKWEFGKPTGGGSYDHDPTGGYTGANVFGYNLHGNYDPNLSAARYLTTGAIDCLRLSGVELHFQRWLGIESATWDHADIEVSTDNQTWTVVWEHTGNAAISESAWSEQAYDLSAIADHQHTVYIRWGMGPTDLPVCYPGWNLDDIEIWGVAEEGRGDVNCDGRVDFDDIDPFMLALANPEEYVQEFPECNIFLADLNGDGVIDFQDIDPFVALLMK